MATANFRLRVPATRCPQDPDQAVRCLVDIRMSELDGIEATRQLAGPAARNRVELAMWAHETGRVRS